ncbi:MAG: hypothetical protein PHC39_11730 [Proteiniphilum sp.]|nr:hypothetical protein [Proteiniphilum sp.]
MVDNINNNLSEINIFFGNFLDEFYAADYEDKKKMVFEEPLYYKVIPHSSYAYIAAMVDFLCNKYELEKPQWIFKDRYYLKDPYFTHDFKGDMRIILLIESPLEFKIRNVFVSENALTRV